MDDGTRGLRLTNTLTRQKEALRPLDWADAAIPDADKRVRMYVCGPTVYDYAHIGNARPVIVFDVLFRLLQHLYDGRVTYVRNITDVDDKIIARAAEEHPGLPLNDAIRKVTQETEAQFHADAKALGCLEPTHEPRATEYIDRMRAMIERLVEKGNAYVAADHVLFQVSTMPDYGRLSGRTLDEMLAGSRVEVAPYKRDPMDFVLWKPSKEGEPAWPSPAGIAAPGRPGWHIECSAMSEAFLGQVFDIHGGGIDLVFPHHENELAQSRCAHGTERMAQIWLHNGYLQVEGAKMSKSAGNFVTVRELLGTPLPALIDAELSAEQDRIRREWNGVAIRLGMLQTRYREPLDWTEERFFRASDELYRWYELLRSKNFDSARRAPASLNALDAVVDALLDDLNTPLALTALRDAFDSQHLRKLGEGMELLGLLQPNFLKPDIFLFDRESVLPELRRSEIKVLVDARAEARKRKDWAEADRIRDELDAMGIALKDSKDPETGELTTTWELRR